MWERNLEVASFDSGSRKTFFGENKPAFEVIYISNSVTAASSSTYYINILN